MEEFLITLGARPSWSRQIQGDLSALENFPDVERFVDALRELDPNGVFSNAARVRMYGF